MTNNTEKNSSNTLSVVNFILILIIGLFILVNQNEQDHKTNALVEIITSKHTVDFSISDIQKVDDVFMLTDASQKKHLTGISFTGRIINTQSVNRLNLKFKLEVNDKNKEFTINKISSGNSTGFNVYLPELTLNNARYVKIEHLSSQVEYLTK